MATRSDPAAAGSETSTARSAPIASAFRSASAAFSGPTLTTTTSPPCASLIRSASSTAFRSVAFKAPSPERSMRPVAGSMRFVAVASGTCFTHTAIFMRPILPRRLLGGRSRKSGRRPRFAKLREDGGRCYGQTNFADANRSMLRHRTTPRGIPFLLLIAAVAASFAVARSASAAVPGAGEGTDAPVATILFPVLGAVSTPTTSATHVARARTRATTSSSPATRP